LLVVVPGSFEGRLGVSVPAGVVDQPSVADDDIEQRHLQPLRQVCSLGRGHQAASID
jgi:hypothetical protein